MDVKFQDLEVVRVTGEVVTRQKQWRLTGEIGFISGWTDPYPDGHRDFAVHFNTFGEVIGVPQGNLESLGRIADPSEIKTRSRAHQRRRAH
jgi:hypothetical protein